MTCATLLKEGVLDTWYEVTNSIGVYNVVFKRAKIVNNSLMSFSIKDITDDSDKVKVLEKMFYYATINNLERVNFINNKNTLEVTIDILETER